MYTLTTKCAEGGEHQALGKAEILVGDDVLNYNKVVKVVHTVVV